MLEISEPFWLSTIVSVAGMTVSHDAVLPGGGNIFRDDPVGYKGAHRVMRNNHRFLIHTIVGFNMAERAINRIISGGATSITSTRSVFPRSFHNHIPRMCNPGVWGIEPATFSNAAFTKNFSMV